MTLAKTESEKLKLTQNDKNNSPIIFTIFGIQSIVRINLLRYETNMESKGGMDFALKINFPKNLTIISVATKIMTVLVQNLPK